MNSLFRKLALSLTLMILIGGKLLALQCSNHFTHPVQSHEEDGKIELQCGAYLINSPNINIPTKDLNIENNCTNTCGSAHCQASNTVALKITQPTFQQVSGNNSLVVDKNESVVIGGPYNNNYEEIKVEEGATLEFNSFSPETVYKIKDFTAKKDTITILAPGSYWLEELKLEIGSKLIIKDGGMVKLYIKDKLTLLKDVFVNYAANSSARNLFIYAYNDLKLSKDSNIKALFYVVDNVDIEKDAKVVGAISAKDIKLDQEATVEYDSDSVAYVCGGVDSIHHFVLSHDNNAIYCHDEEITVTAKDSSNNTLTNFAETVVLDTNTGTGSWYLVTGNGSFSDSVANDGMAAYTFAATDNGVATFALNYPEGPNTVDLDAYLQSDNTIRDQDTEGKLSFAPYGFVITSAPIANNPTVFPSSYSGPQIAGIADTMYIAAYGQIGPGQCGVITDYSGVKNLKFWQSYNNPNSGTLTTLVDNENVSNNANNPLSKNINFISGKASIVTKYRDVGSIKLHVKDDANNNILQAATNNYVVKPAKFAINVSNNPAASDADGGILTTAGSPFTATVTVQDNDGNTTPNYGNESPAAAIKIYSSNLVAPIGGRNGSGNNGLIANNTSFTKTSPGVFSGNNFSFDEVGIIKLTAEVASQDYLGAGNASGPESGNVGRFIPHHFASVGNTPIIQSAVASAGLTYLNQSFNYNTSPQIDLTAENLTNNTTQNYSGSFWKLSNSDVTAVYNSNSNVATFDSISAELPSSINVVANGDGTGFVNFTDGGGFKFLKPVAANATNFNAEIELQATVTDSDGVTTLTSPHVFGGITAGNGIEFAGSLTPNNKIYHGQIYLTNTIGSELLDLTIPMQIKYFDGNSFVTNTIDSSTSISDPAYVLLTPDPSNLTTTATISGFNSGVGSITLSAPNNAVTGTVDVELELSSLGANLAHLQGDWPYDGNQDGVSDDNPQALATFGIDKGSDNILYIKEIY